MQVRGCDWSRLAGAADATGRGDGIFVLGGIPAAGPFGTQIASARVDGGVAVGTTKGQGRRNGSGKAGCAPTADADSGQDCKCMLNNLNLRSSQCRPSRQVSEAAGEERVSRTTRTERVVARLQLHRARGRAAPCAEAARNRWLRKVRRMRGYRGTRRYPQPVHLPADAARGRADR